MESPLARRAVSDFSCSTGVEGALQTWGIVHEDEKGSADDFNNGATVGDDKMPTRQGFLYVPAGEGGRGS